MKLEDQPNIIPNFLKGLLIEQYGEQISNNIINGHTCKRKSSFRVNTLKSTVKEIKEVLDKEKIKYSQADWYDEAIIIDSNAENSVKRLNIYDEGKIYFQSLSSMIPSIILEPKENEDILDMTAAPGSKTTQISAMTNGRALITAIEKNKIRAERLRYNIEKSGAPRINMLVQDARKLDDIFSFDKILLDAPCSGSGTLDINNNNINESFTEELIFRSTKLQYELLRKAIKILKPGHEIVYSTCSILKQENEENIKKILKDGNVDHEHIVFSAFSDSHKRFKHLRGVFSKQRSCFRSAHWRVAGCKGIMPVCELMPIQRAHRVCFFFHKITNCFYIPYLQG